VVEDQVDKFAGVDLTSISIRHPNLKGGEV